ncbi:phosphoribosylformylglycinamidine synthase I [Acidianus sp. RZ1]|uniref:phosphoribosylformylglycinamidine synthase I n=1 Tax=Acidianus sp. RZ1 TaxID=1540082 RepID=UPI001492E698|nr:phosphoribosylformylglycinamidine synthase I [Acidianus sp. RZ1]NON62802.1 phosphoribosylformylglycinamidine synthase I [Acidianus sp. RZ1]
MKTAIIKFPGTTCEFDVLKAIEEAKGEAEVVKYKEFDPDRFNAVILAGGFSFGDYLRAGSVAANSDTMAKVKEMVNSGKKVLGICNGFQILVESNLLEGGLLPNLNMRFISKWIYLKIVKETALTKGLKGKVIKLPIAHAEGRYYHDNPQRASELAVFQYTNNLGEVDEKSNPNGSLLNIAGISNEEGNVIGLMPHPERASFPLISPDGSSDGLMLLRSFLR